ILIDVTTGPARGSVAATEAANKRTVAHLASYIKCIKLNADLKPVTDSESLGSPQFGTMLLAHVLCIPLFILIGKKRIARANDVRGNRIRRADRLARKYLSAAKKNLGNPKTFYVALEKALHNYLKAKLHITTSEMSKDRIADLLREKGVESELIS